MHHRHNNQKNWPLVLSRFIIARGGARHRGPQLLLNQVILTCATITEGGSLDNSPDHGRILVSSQGRGGHRTKATWSGGSSEPWFKPRARTSGVGLPLQRRLAQWGVRDFPLGDASSAGPSPRRLATSAEGRRRSSPTRVPDKEIYLG